MADANFEDFFGAGAALRIKPRPAGSDIYENFNIGQTVEGFSGGGDFIELPAAIASVVEYFNSSGASQWTLDKTTINAAIDAWVGFYLDATDNLLYIIAKDTGTTPNTYYTASMNAAGTLVNIGNDQPTVDFSIPTGTGWNGQGAGHSSVARDVDGSGNLFIRQREGQEMEIDITDGTAGDAVAFYNLPSTSKVYNYKTADGTYIATGPRSASIIPVNLVTNDFNFPVTMMDASSGLSQAGGSVFLILQAWKGYVTLIAATATAIDGPRQWNKTDMDDLVTEIKKLYE